MLQFATKDVERALRILAKHEVCEGATIAGRVKNTPRGEVTLEKFLRQPPRRRYAER